MTAMGSKPGLLFHVLLLSATLMQFQRAIVMGEPQVPCYFPFGDSLVDNGNNNRLNTAAKANYPPYGIDFPDGATGRFTNGLNLADFLAQLLGFSDFIPPFANAPNDILNGVNYASGAAGIRAESGRQLGARINFDSQLLNHATIVAQLYVMQRNITFTREYLKKCIYTVNIGSNDYINNYLMPNNYLTSRLYTPDRYAAILVNQYSRQLKTLYNLGARKVAVFGLGLVGCAPQVIAMSGSNGTACVDSVNSITKLFDDRLKPLVDDLNSVNPDAQFIYINVTSISIPDGGVALPNIACCPIRSDGQCIPNSIPCPNRNLSIWYDGYHPTTIAAQSLASRSYTEQSPTDTYPYDISTLAQTN